MLTMLYIVHWPAEHIVKIGRAGHMARVRRFTDTGAQVLVLVQGRSAADETAALAAVRSIYPRAFETAAQSTHLLGFRGSGFSECFSVPTSELANVIETAFRGVASGSNPIDKA